MTLKYQMENIININLIDQKEPKLNLRSIYLKDLY